MSLCDATKVLSLYTSSKATSVVSFSKCLASTVVLNSTSPFSCSATNSFSTVTSFPSTMNGLFVSLSIHTNLAVYFFPTIKLLYLTTSVNTTLSVGSSSFLSFTVAFVFTVGFLRSVIVTFPPSDFTISSSATFVTFTFPSLSTSNSISVTVKYPSGAASSWNTYFPALNFNSLAVSVDSQETEFTLLPFSLIKFVPSADLTVIFAPANSFPPKSTLLTFTG